MRVLNFVNERWSGLIEILFHGELLLVYVHT